MMVRSDFHEWIIFFSMLVRGIFSLNLVSCSCELSVPVNNKLYSFSLASSTPKFPHGALSEDGFYKVEVNETVLWFQLCDAMIFNHDQPLCVGCWDSRGSSHCGMGCSALVANNIEGYDVCTCIGDVSDNDISLFDKRNPQDGVVVKMSRNGSKVNCSLSVSVICDTKGVQVPYSVKKLGSCDYATVLKHPSGCAKTSPFHGRGWGWFGTFMITVLCLFGGYLLAGAVYRYFVLKVRGIRVIPNLDFWTTVPHRTRSLGASLIQKLRGPTKNHRNSYSPVNF